MSVDRQLIHRLLATAFGHAAPAVVAVTDAGQGRGVFSTVVRIELQWRSPSKPQQPRHVVAKLPLAGPNGAAAVASGAYRREAEAYRRILVGSPVQAPGALAVVETGEGGYAFLLDDLTLLRRVDQLDGLGEQDATAVALALGRLHRHWAGQTGPVSSQSARRDVLGSIDPTSIQAGLAELRRTWGNELSDELLAGFERVAEAVRRHNRPIEDINNITLCHGDPRADNVVFDASDGPVLFDWQQVMINPGEYDLAWLTATSLTVENRRRFERNLIEAYGGDFDVYRAGFAIPATLVLMLVQRQMRSGRLKDVTEASLKRIGQALVDLDIADRWV